MRLFRTIGVALASVLLIGLTACSPTVEAPSETATASAAETPQATVEPSTAEPSTATTPTVSSSTPEPVAAPSPTAAAQQPPAPEVGDHGPATCGDLGFVGDTAPPAQLAELGVPFSECVIEMVAMPGSDPLFVGEYDTDQEMIAVEMLFKDLFELSDWEVISNGLDGEFAVTQAQRPGYHLVVAIGPSRSADAVSAIHYTLRAE